MKGLSFVVSGDRHKNDFQALFSTACFSVLSSEFFWIHTHLMLIHVVAVTYSQWFIVTNLLVYRYDIHGLANDLFGGNAQVLLQPQEAHMVLHVL